MTTSGTYSFSQNTIKLVRGALRLVGAIESGETVNADMYVDAVESLNGMVKAQQQSSRPEAAAELSLEMPRFKSTEKPEHSPMRQP